MAKTTKVAWGIDVGNCTLKAIKLAGSADSVEVLDFAVIEHEKILSQPDLDPQQRSEMIGAALRKFLDKHDVGGATVVASVSGQSSFARFIKLPPVEKKRIPEIVRFEASQQIPFDINDVEWDWQTLRGPESTEVEVGIFAIKKDLVGKALRPFTQAGCPVHIVQMAPMALYNFLYQDQPRLRDGVSKEALILLDIGAVNTDLVIADGNRVWQRSIPIGGNQFTAAVQKAFKLGFAKAEAIKRSASTSKYARQIFQAMRSVFADLAAEVQRSLGFYGSSNREVQFRQVLALGNTMKLPGLVKFLQQSLSLPVKRLSSFESLKLSGEISVAQFAENLPSFSVAYGLAVQGLDNGAITSNLLPRDLARQTQWQRKRPWFVAAASLFLVASLIYLFQVFSENRDINSQLTRNNISNLDSLKRTIIEAYNKQADSDLQIRQSLEQISQLKQYYLQRNVIPQILQVIRDCLPHENNIADPQQQQLHRAFSQQDRALVMKLPRNQRPQIFINRIKIVPIDDLNLPFSRVFTEETGQSGAGVGAPTAGGGLGQPGGVQLPTGGPPGQAFDPALGMAPPAATEPGYAVLIEGTTPHNKGFEFLQPPGKERERSNWGFLHKLRYMGKTDADIAADLKAREEMQANPQGGGLSGGISSLPYGGAVASNTTGVPGGGTGAGLPDAAGGPPSDMPPEQATETAPVSPIKQDYPGQISPGILPFETYVDPAATDEKQFFNPIYGLLSPTEGPSHKPGQPELGAIGILKVEEETTGQVAGGVASTGINPPGRPGTAAGASRGGIAPLNVYLDPFTREPISESYQYDAAGNVKRDRSGNPLTEKNDFWFRVMFKIKMKPQESNPPTSEDIG